jgi:hypothetical protein
MKHITKYKLFENKSASVSYEEVVDLLSSITDDEHELSIFSVKYGFRKDAGNRMPFIEDFIMDGEIDFNFLIQVEMNDPVPNFIDLLPKLKQIDSYLESCGFKLNMSRFGYHSISIATWIKSTDQLVKINNVTQKVDSKTPIGDIKLYYDIPLSRVVIPTITF